MKKITGSVVALVTPFNADGSVDLGRLRGLVDWHIENQTDAILVLGTTGETASTTLEEDIVTVRTVIEQANGQNVLVAYWYQHDHERVREYLTAPAADDLHL